LTGHTGTNAGTAIRREKTDYFGGKWIFFAHEHALKWNKYIVKQQPGLVDAGI
jgi:hypothetical protein